MGEILKKEKVMTDLLTKTHLERYAQVMIWALKKARRGSGNGGEYKPGDIVRLWWEPSAGDLARCVYPLMLQEGWNVVLDPDYNFHMERIFYKFSSEDQIKFVEPGKIELTENLNGGIKLFASDSLTHLKDCDSKKISLRSSTNKQFLDILEKRELDGEFGWTLCVMPTPALAAQANMSVEEYTQEIIKSCYLDHEDPVGKWVDTYTKMSRIRRWLMDMPIEYVHVQSDDGEIDLKVWIGEKRKWLDGGGYNIPSFEIFTSPYAGRAEGKYYANEPSFKDGHYVKSVRLEFKDGKVIKATAEQEEGHLRSILDTDPGAKMIGEFSLTDKRFSNITRFMADTLFDENVGGPNGNCHIAIGDSYPQCFDGKGEVTKERKAELGFNDSAIHWDLVNTQSKIVTAYMLGGGTYVIYQDGMFNFSL